MAFQEKIDLVGFEQTGIKLKANAQNATNGVLPIHGSDGSILGDEKYGHVRNPSCDYVITAGATLDITLGKCYNGRYALQSVTISSGAGQEPTVSATAVQVEEDAEATVCTYKASSVAVSPARHALKFGAFDFTETVNLTLQSSTYNAVVSIDPATVNGDPVASDATDGVETVSVTMWSSSETEAPAITLSDGWSVTSDWTCVGADSSMFVWTATLTHYLTVEG